MGTGHPLSWSAIGCLAWGFRSILCCRFDKSILNIRVASNRCTVGPYWHHSLLTLGAERLSGARLGGWTLNTQTVDIALDFSYVKWPLGIVSTSGVFRSSNGRLRLDCSCCVTVTERVRKQRWLWGDWGQKFLTKCLKKTAFLLSLWQNVVRFVFGKKGKKPLYQSNCIMHTTDGYKTNMDWHKMYNASV